MVVVGHFLRHVHKMSQTQNPPNKHWTQNERVPWQSGRFVLVLEMRAKQFEVQCSVTFCFIVLVILIIRHHYPMTYRDLHG